MGRWGFHVLFLVGIALGASDPTLQPTEESPFKGLLIAVVTAPAHTNARNAIRDTWAQDAHMYGIRVKYFVGQLPENCSISDQEIDAEENIVRLDDFTESYHNLTTKALNIFTYAFQNKYRGVFKVDDDTYVNIESLVDFLRLHPDWASMYAGNLIPHQRVGTNPEGRWYAYDQFLEDYYPPYCNGMGFFLGQDLLKFLVENKAGLVPIRVDDAAVGVWLVDQPKNVVEMRSSNYEYHPKSGAVWINPLNPNEMRRLYVEHESFIPHVCTERPTDCLCFGHPMYSDHERDECWTATGDLSYQDLVPR